MKKFFSIFTALAAVLPLCACANTEVSSDSGTVSDPFSETSIQQNISSEENESTEKVSSTPSEDTLESIREHVITLSNCGVAMTVNNEALTYDGEPVKVSLTLKPSEQNEISCSCGVSVFINGLAQEVSSDGVDYDYMAVYKDLKPATEYAVDLYFKPSVLPEDKGKDSLEVSFVQCTNADYEPSPKYLTLWGTHFFGRLRTTVEMKLNAEIAYVPEKNFESDFTSEMIIKPTHDMSDFIPNNLKDGEYGLLYLDEDGSLSATYSLQNTGTGRHRLTLFVNNRPVTFNGGKSFCDIDVEPQTKYLLNIKLDENPSELDCIYMLDFYEEKINDTIYTYASSATPKIIVAHDFVR